MGFRKKKQVSNTQIDSEVELSENVLCMSVARCLEFVKEGQNISQIMGENQQPQRKFLRFDEESHLLLIRGIGSAQKLDVIYVEDIKEVRYAGESFMLVAQNPSIDSDLLVSIKFRENDCFLWKTFSFEAFEPEAAQKWVHSLRELKRAEILDQTPTRKKEIFIQRFPLYLDMISESRPLNAKDLKLFLCDVLNYKVGTDELNDIMRLEGLEEDAEVELSHLLSIYNRLTFDPELIKQHFGADSKNPLFPSITDLIGSKELAKFLANEGETTVSPDQIIELFGDGGKLTAPQFLEYLYSDLNEILPPKSEVTDLMDSPLSHYWIASSHNTYLPGNQIASKSSVEAYIQVLLSGCKCVELDVWAYNKSVMIFHGTCGIPLFNTMIFAEDVLKAISMYAFKVSPYPVILSIENHLNTDMQEEFAKLLRRVLGDKLLTAPVEDGGRLPTPNMLLNKILIKDKKSVKDNFDLTVNQSIQKRDKIYFESSTKANDWSERVTILTPDFLYYSYQDTTDELRERSNAVSTNRPIQENKLSELHLAEPWYWGDSEKEEAEKTITNYVRRMRREQGPDVQLAGDFAIRLKTHCRGEFVLQFLDSRHHQKKILVHSRCERGLPRYYIEDTIRAPSFDCLYSLIKHYQRHAFSVEKVKMILKRPIEEPRKFEKEPWFHHDASLVDSERRLREHRVNGAFLVREEPPNNFRLMFRAEGSFKRCKIRQDGRLWVIGNSKFEGLAQLIKYYQKNPLYTTKNNQQIKLSKAVHMIELDPQVAGEGGDEALTDRSYVSGDELRDRPEEMYEAEEDYHGRNEEELTFLRGAIIQNVTEETQKVGWCVGDYGPRKRKRFPKYLVRLYEEEEWPENPLGNMCDGAIPLRNSTHRKHNVSDNSVIPHYLTIKGEGGEEWRLGFLDYEQMDRWSGWIEKARRKKIPVERVKTKRASDYSALVIYAQARPAPADFTAEAVARYNYKEMCSFDENRLESYTQKPNSERIIPFTNSCFLRVYPKNTRTSSSNFEPMLAWTYGCQLVALNYQTPDTPMQINWGRFAHSNGGCGYVRKPADMTECKFNPRQLDTCPDSVALFVTILGGRMLFSEAGSQPRVRVSLEGLDSSSQQTRPAEASLVPRWDWEGPKSVISLLCMNPEIAIIRFEVHDSNAFDDVKLVGHCTFPVSQLRPGYRSVRLYDGHGHERLLSRLLVHVERESLKAHDPDRELMRLRNDILQLNDYLHDADSVQPAEMERLREAEKLYFGLVEKKGQEMNGEANGARAGAPDTPGSFTKQRSEETEQRRTLSRGKTYVRMSISRPKLPKRPMSIR